MTAGPGRPSEPTELRVDPVRVGGGRRPAVPALIVAIVAITFVSLALWKPWDRGSARPGGIPRPGASGLVADATRNPSPSANPDVPPFPTPIDPFPTKETLLASTTTQRSWGIRTVVLPGGTTPAGGAGRLAERWLPIDVAVGAAWTLADNSAIGGSTDDILAIGVTTPDDALPLDVRFWRLDRSAFPERVVAIAIPGPEPASWLWLPDPAQATVLGTWPAGTYRIDVLLGPRIVRLVATIPHAAPSVAPTPAAVSSPPVAAMLSGLPVGPFAIVAGRLAPILGGTGPLVDERKAWLGAAVGLTLDSVARISSPAVSGFGVFLAPGQQPVGLTLAMVPAASAGPEVTLDAISDPLSNQAALVVRPVSNGPLPAGLYRLTASWTGGAPGSASWQVEIVPSTPAIPPVSPLEEMGRWIGVLGSPDNLAQQPVLFPADGATLDVDGCSTSTRITPADPLIGIAVPTGFEVRRVRMSIIGAVVGGGVPLRIALNAIPRLTIVAVPSGGLGARRYDLLVNVAGPDGDQVLGSQFCVR